MNLYRTTLSSQLKKIFVYGKMAKSTPAGSTLSPAPTRKRHIDLLSGWPNPALLPPLQLDKAAHAALSNQAVAVESLRYAPDEGYMPLREEIAKWLTKFYTPKDPVTFDRICITGGASQNLACVLQTFTDPVYTRNIWMVAPTYFLACRIFDDNGFSGRLRGIPEDEEGIDIDYLKKHLEISERAAVDQGNTEPKLKTRYPWRKTYKHVFYAVPTFANPSGRIMSQRRREQLVRLAREYDALIVTDDVYDMLQWSADPSRTNVPFRTATHPRIVDVDRYLDGGPTSEWGNALSNGSFSKIIAPGCRTGWAETTPKLGWALSQCGSSRSGGAPSALVASMIHQMMAAGRLAQHITELLLPAYEKRYNRMMQSIQNELLPLGVTVPPSPKDVTGGYFIWLTLPRPLDADAISEHAAEKEDLKVIAGSKFRVVGDEDKGEMQFNHDIRLCFAFEEFDKLEEGVLRLAKVIEANLSDQAQEH